MVSVCVFRIYVIFYSHFYFIVFYIIERDKSKTAIELSIVPKKRKVFIFIYVCVGVGRPNVKLKTIVLRIICTE